MRMSAGSKNEERISMGETKLRFVRSGAAVILAATLSSSMIPAAAFAEAAEAANDAVAAAASEGRAVDHTNLANGTYTAEVGVLKATDTSSSSMMAGAVANPATITVKDGVYTVTLGLQGVTMMGTTYYATDFSYYTGATTVANNVAQSSGDEVKATANGLQPDGESPTSISFPLASGNIADGLAMISMTLSGSMGSMMGYQKALVEVDWDTLETVSIDVDKTGLNGAIAAAKGFQQGNKTDEAWEALQAAIAEAERVSADESATQEQVTAAAATLGRAMAAFNASADKETEEGTFAEGVTYAVPVSFYKTGSDETSMAGRVFAASAEVVKQGEQYRVRLTSQGQMASMITSVGYGDGL